MNERNDAQASHKQKILSVSIAAYNVEKYIRNTLMSCAVDPILDDIEVIVVNDGSTDQTKEIADEFVRSYPNTFKVIDKENEGYGSTVMLGIQNATGKFFKLLDGDDWFDKDGIYELVEVLKKTDADAVVSSRVVSDGKDYNYIAPPWADNDGNTIKRNDFDYHKPFGIWELTVRTDLLKAMDWDMPLHCFYTDQIFVMKALTKIQTVRILAKPTYCYRRGIEEQSSSRSSRIKHISEFLLVYDILQDIYLDNRYENGKENVMLRHRFDKYYRTLIRTYLLQDVSKDIKQEIIRAERQIKKSAPEIYEIRDAEIKERIMIKLLRITGYMAYYPIALVGIPNWG